MSKRLMDFAHGLKDPVVVRIAKMYDAKRAANRWISWEEYFPPRPGESIRRADASEAIRCSESTRRRGLQGPGWGLRCCSSARFRDE